MKQYRYEKTVEELGRKGSVFGLDTMRRLLDLLGHPENGLKVIHVAGTNGKGSTIAFLESILRKCGYSVGKYISPTILCYEERFQVDGDYIPRERLEDYYDRLRSLSGIMEERGWETPTLFEAETAIALSWFLDKKVDYALVETGMGGLMDATNAMESVFLTVLTSISEDHKAVLGESLEEIALHKAGIIRRNTPVILAINKEEVRKVVRKVCRDKGTDCLEVLPEEAVLVEETGIGSVFTCGQDYYRIRLPGAHQAENALTALKAAFQLKTMPGGEKINDTAIKEGLEKTVWPGRLELISQDPPFYLDGAHNPDGAARLAAFLRKQFAGKRIVFIMGILKDKDYPAMLSFLMPLAAGVYVFTPRNLRGLPAEELAAAMAPYPVPVKVCAGVCQAVDLALREEKKADCFVLCGSLSFMEEFRKRRG